MANKVKADFTDVESGGLIAEGEYTVKVDKAEVKKSQSSGKKYISWTMKVVGGDSNGRKLYYVTSLQPQALFNLRGLLEAMGITVSGAMELDLDSYIGMKLNVIVGHDKYEGKTRAKIQDVVQLGAKAGSVDDDDEDDDDEDEKPVKKSKKPEPVKSKKKIVDDDEDEEEVDDDEEEEPVAPKKKKLGRPAKESSKANVKKRNPLDDDEDDEEDDE